MKLFVSTILLLLIILVYTITKPGVSKYTLSPVQEDINPTVNRTKESVMIKWNPSTDPNTKWLLSDGNSLLSPVLTNSSTTYTINYSDLKSTIVYIHSSPDGTNWSLGTEIRSVVPDVDPSTVTFSFSGDGDAIISFDNPMISTNSSFQYYYDVLLKRPLQITDDPTVTNTISSLVNGIYSFALSIQSSFITIYCRALGTQPGDYTYGTTLYFNEPNPSLPADVEGIEQTPRSDGSGVDITSFFGYANSYAVFINNNPTLFISYKDVLQTPHNIFSMVSSHSKSLSIYDTEITVTPFTILFPPITNINIVPGTTSVTITWDAGVNIDPGNSQSWVVKSASGLSRIVATPSVTINYNDLTMIDTVFISTKYIGQSQSLALTRVLFYKENLPTLYTTLNIKYYWSFEDSTTDLIASLAPSDDSKGSPTYVVGKHRKAINIQNDITFWQSSVIVAYPVNLSTSAGFSVSFWFKQSSKETYNQDWNGYQCMLGMSTSNGYFDITVRRGTNGTINMYAHNQGEWGMDSAINPTVGNWYHVCAVFSGTSVIMYVNGNQVKSGTQPNNATINLLFLGRSGQFDGHPSAAAFDDLCIFNKALTSNEVLSVYNL